MFDGAHIDCREPRNTEPGVFERSFGTNKVALQILMVDDNPGDIRLARETFRQARASVQLHVAFDGVEAMAFLRSEGVHADAPRPDLIMLDLNMPRMDGREVLAAMKADERLKLIPTVILTGSDGEAHLAKDYELNPKCYIVKPLHLDAFEVLMSSVIDFWRTRERVSISTSGLAQVE